MGTSTAVWQLYKPNPDPVTGDNINVATDINDNMDRIEAALNNHESRIDNIEALPSGFVRKIADESVTSSTVMQNDDVLAFSVTAGKNYYFDMVVVANSTSSAIDMKVGFTFPAGKMSYGVMGMDPAVASGVVGAGAWSASDDTVTSGGNIISVGVGAATPPLGTTVRITGQFQCTTSGTVQFQWAQNTSTASALTVKSGSFLKWEVVP